MNNKKHLALISVHGDPAVEIGKEEAGGQNVYVRKVGEALAEQGWIVDMFTRASDAQQPKIVEHRSNCRTIRLTAGPEDFVPRQEIFSYREDFVREFLEFQRDREIDYDLCHTNYWISGWVGLQFKEKLSIPMLHTYHSLGAVKYKSIQAIPMIAATRLAVEKDCLEQADCIVATSPQEREHMESLVSTKGTIDVIPCGTDIKHFRAIGRQEARTRLGIAPDAKMVFYIGRFDRRKGIETLVRAVGQSRSRNDERLQLIIGGGSRPGRSDGIERDRIEGIVKELDLEEITTFPGRISDEDLPYYYAAADACVVPSHYEPFGLVAIEAMASGTPAIASDVGGLQFTVVHEETGILAPPKDVEAFSAGIDRILSDPQWQKQLGQNARKRVEEKFSWNGVATQLSDLYLKTLADSKDAVSKATA
ncbi:glycosyltransferase family 1 protein [Lusitaniella coriacea LEGE 07157]|uniref:Glycosyltransferase family 1 protein n=1 Tax=Lusitaniella coriacea LEGE 07157 TaxID=945747 RepID=A0A8J7JBP0_9CYAN|nr:glycosyltransferase family 1 protein [Lusitaniella coriacea]MBE9116955.1 glycosyltransferase family 1 protein [Lusitaniella coriacea LEGE 07157]